MQEGAIRNGAGSPRPGDGATADTVLDRTFNLLEFLSAVAREVGPAPVRAIGSHPFVLRSEGVPRHQAVVVGTTTERTTWLSVDRVRTPDPARLPDYFDGLLTNRACLTDPKVTPRLDDSKLSTYIAELIEHEKTAALEELRVAGAIDEPAVTDDDVLAGDERDQNSNETQKDGDNQRAEEIRDEVVRDFARWIDDTWTRWASTTRIIIAARELYGRLYDLHLMAEADNATHEIVVGHALLRSTRGAERIDAPMLVTRVSLTVDPRDARLAITPEGTPELEIDALEGTHVRGLDVLAGLKAQLRQNPPDVWSDEELGAVRRQIIAPLGLDARLAEDTLTAATAASITLDDSWVLLLRKRAIREERFYDDLAHKIRDEKFLPQALASVLSDDDQVSSVLRARTGSATIDDGTADRLLMPLPSNDEQERIARQLAKARGVTVQGPPGTGKSHAIANLVSHLVAQGKRVLVTAQNEQALTVLRDKIPEELRDLSLAIVGSSTLAIEQLRGSVQSLQDSIWALDIDRALARVKALGGEIDALRTTQARLDAALVGALRSEQELHDLPHGPAPAADVAKWLASDRQLDIIPDAVPADAELPLSPDGLAELAKLAEKLEPDDIRASTFDLPVADWLPTAGALRTTLEQLEHLRSSVTHLEDGGLRIERVDELTPEAMAGLAGRLRAASGDLRRLSGTWEGPFADQVRSNAEIVAWVIHQCDQVRERLDWAAQFLNAQAGHDVSVPDGDPNVQLPLLAEWRARVAAGKKISFTAPRALKELSAAVAVDGYPVTTTHQVDLVDGAVRLRTLIADTHRLMTQVLEPIGAPVPAAGPTFVFSARETIDRIAAVRAWWAEVYPVISAELVPFVTANDPAATPEALHLAAELLDRASSRFKERDLTLELDRLELRLLEQATTANASPLWSMLADALQLADTTIWRQAQDEARRLDRLRADIARREELTNLLSAAGAPRWSRSIVDSRGASDVVGDTHNALTSWARARARTWLTTLHAETDVAALMETSHSTARRLSGAVLEAANLSARIELKLNLKDSRRRALDTWLTAIRRVGKGTGKNAPRFQAEARDALPAAMGAIPIWIMPIHRVMENFSPTESDLFDVVIVDESSQCDLLSLGVLALGEKAVVVGDDRQTTPQRPGTSTDKIASLQEQHLRGMAGARLLTIDESLYSISGRVFPSTIALREHFRSVPEIIEFSNRYYDGKILPLREITVPQIGAPLRAVQVEGAVSQTQGSHRINLDEATAIADQVAACVADPAYDGLTLGVVTMMSGPQSDHIQNAIRERIGDEEFERRRLRVGNPPLFQGDERNVIFISTVAHDASFAATKLQYSQWANVAVSRAQDQLWVFYSMDPTTLNHQDQRRAIIEYVVNRNDARDHSAIVDMTESKFERDVLEKMLERGYDLEAQHKVGAYRIDFVVNVGPGARLAVECDGDSFHGPEKWSDDVRRQRVLERLGWNFWRIRASEYYLDPVAAMEPLWEKLEAMRAEARERAKARERQAELVAERQRAAALETARLAAEAAERRMTIELAEPVIRTGSHPAGPLGVGNGGYLGATLGSSPVPPADDLSLTRQSDSAASPPRASFTRGISSASRIREWATSNGYDIGERGRIPEYIQTAYEAAHPDQEAPRPTSDGDGTESPGVLNTAHRNTEASTVREWAINNGYDIGERGRIPEYIRTAYGAAHWDHEQAPLGRAGDPLTPDSSPTVRFADVTEVHTPQGRPDRDRNLSS